MTGGGAQDPGLSSDDELAMLRYFTSAAAQLTNRPCATTL